MAKLQDLKVDHIYTILTHLGRGGIAQRSNSQRRAFGISFSQFMHTLTDAEKPMPSTSAIVRYTTPMYLHRWVRGISQSALSTVSTWVFYLFHVRFCMVEIVGASFEKTTTRVRQVKALQHW